MPKKHINRALFALAILCPLLVSAPAAEIVTAASLECNCHSDARFSVRDEISIRRIAILPRTGGEGYLIRIQSDGRRPAFSEPEFSGSDNMTITFYNATLSDTFTQTEPAGPVMAFSIGNAEGSVILRVSFLKPGISVNIYGDTESPDILVSLSSSSSGTRITDSAESARTNRAASSEGESEGGGQRKKTPGFTGTSSSDSPSSDPGVEKGPSVNAFRTALLAATRELSRDSASPHRGSIEKATVNAEYNSQRMRSFPETHARARPLVMKSAERWKLDTIVLDAGHGGWDEGAVSSTGLKEKDLALFMVRKLGALLEQELGVSVIFTRTGDDFVPLARRGKIANQSGGKLFVSIHANKSRTRSARGTETYFLGTHRSDSARVVMERENEVVEMENSADQYQIMDSGALARKRLTQSTNLQHSEALASMIQTSFTDYAGRENRGVKQAGFYVLFGASMPAVLVELGFLSNPEEARYLSTNSGQTQMVRAIFQAIARFKRDYEKALNVTSL